MVLSVAVEKVHQSLNDRCYREASDILAGIRHLNDLDPQSVIEKAVLEIRCQLALSNLEPAFYAWQDIDDALSDNPQLRSNELMLLGARLFWASGDITKSMGCCRQAIELAENSAERILAEATLARITYNAHGDALSILNNLLPHWTALSVDNSYKDQTKHLQEKLRLALAIAALAQGKVHLTKEVIKCVNTPNSVLGMELYLLQGIMDIFEGKMERSVSVAQDADLIQLSDGSSRQERIPLLWWQTWILHAAGCEREAQRKAEDFLHLTTSCIEADFKVYADLLLASCLFQRKSFTKVEQIIDAYCQSDDVLSGGESADLSSPLKVMLILLKALLLSERANLRRARSFLLDHRKELFDPNATMIICLMCHAHENLLTLLCKALGVEHLPTELTDLLDTHAFIKRYQSVEKTLIPAESVRLQKRFIRCTGQGNQNIVLKNKPVEISLFGGLEMRVNGDLLDLRGWGNSRTRHLFICLVVDSGNDLTREILYERLWPNQESKDLRNCYNVTWSQMRRRILNALPKKKDGEAEIVYDAFQNMGGRCMLNVNDVYVDVHRFSQLSSQLSESLLRDDTEACLSAIKLMLEVYRGDLLPGDLYLDWLNVERNSHRKSFMDAMLLGANICLENDEPESSLLYLQRASTIESDNEELHYLSMRAYTAIGRREEAMKSYHNCRRYLSTELGLDPSKRFVDLYQELLCEST